MKRKASLMRNFLTVCSAFLIITIFGCNNTPTDPGTAEPSTDSQAMLKIAQSDSSISSFQPNYDEEDTMNISTDKGSNSYPIKAGQKLRLVSGNLTYNVSGDTAYGVFTQTFEGVLYIAGTPNSDSLSADTVLQKPFTTVVTRNIIFVRIGNSKRPMLNWKIAAISLPEGGTMNSNVKITSLVVFLANGDTISVNNPNNYYLYRGFGKQKHIPEFNPGKPVTVQVEISSAYADTDFVTLTHGADFRGLHREKDKFDLISSTPTANGYDKIYRRTFLTNRFPGYFHAVINAYAKQGIYDYTSPVEINSWGIPYFVK